MRKKFFLIALLFSGIVSFNSCDPNDEEAPVERWPEDVIVTTDVFMDPCLPGPGSCFAVTPCFGWPLNRQQLMLDFYDAYNRSKVDSFFLAKDWYTLFPQLGRYSDAVDSIINGDYAVKLFSGDGSIVISNKPLTDSIRPEDVVFAYKMDGPCGSH